MQAEVYMILSILSIQLMRLGLLGRLVSKQGNLLMSGERVKPVKLLHEDVQRRIRELVSRSGWRREEPLPSYRELAKRYNVSQMTVQRAVGGLIKEGWLYAWPGCGTFVSADAAPQTRKLTHIGLVFYCTHRLFFSSAYLMEIFRGIMWEAESVNADVRIFSIKTEGRLTMQSFEQAGVNGLLLVGVVNDEYIADLGRARIPLVVVDYRSATVPADYVVVENIGAVSRVVEYLRQLGHRRIAYLDGWSTDTVAGTLRHDVVVESSDVIERREGYRQAMVRAGLADDAFVFGGVLNGQVQSIHGVAEDLAREPRRFSAVVAYDTTVARNLMTELSKLNVRIPQDLSIAAVAGAEDALVGGRVLTYNKVPFVRMGSLAVQRLAARCDELPPREPRVTFVDSEFVAGNTAVTLGENRN